MPTEPPETRRAHRAAHLRRMQRRRRGLSDALPLVRRRPAPARLGSRSVARLRRRRLPRLRTAAARPLPRPHAADGAAADPEPRPLGAGARARVAQPVEQAILGLPGVRRVISTLQPGVVQIVVAFESGTDPWRSRQLVAEKLADAARRAFPRAPRRRCSPAPPAASRRSRSWCSKARRSIRCAARPRGARARAAPAVGARRRARRAARRRGAQLQISLVPERLRLAGATLAAGARGARGQRARRRRRPARGARQALARHRRDARRDEPRRCAACRSTPRTVWCRSAISPRCARRPAFASASRASRASRRSRCGWSSSRAPRRSRPRGACASCCPSSSGRCPEGMTLSLFYDQGELVDHALGGVDRGAPASAPSSWRWCSSCCSATCARRSIVLVLLPLATLGAAIPLWLLGHGLERDDAGRTRDRGRPAGRRRRDHGREPRAPPRARASRRPRATRRAVLAAAAAEVAVPIVTAVR